jgi:predicted outer membrane repeat protein
MCDNASISDNTASSSGGGVYQSGTFTMHYNTSVSGNTASSSGGGVYVSGTFTMNGGIIYGSDGGANANKLEGNGTKQGISLYKAAATGIARYSYSTPIIAGDQTIHLYTDATLTGY